jgi:Uma2 family endonuclease
MINMASDTVDRSLSSQGGSVVLPNISWDLLLHLDGALSDTGARLIYLDGWLEIMVPLSAAHEEPRNRLGQLLESYLRVRGIRFYGLGSQTLGLKELGARKEPDESYCIGDRQSIPNLAIEVIVTSGGIDTLEIYRRIGVAEVWFWQDELLSIYHLQPDGYILVNRSVLLPDLDICSLEFHLRMTDQFDAINAFINTLD